MPGGDYFVSTPNKPVILASNKPLQAGELFMKMAFNQVKGHEMRRTRTNCHYHGSFSPQVPNRGAGLVWTQRKVFFNSFTMA